MSRLQNPFQLAIQDLNFEKLEEFVGQFKIECRMCYANMQLSKPLLSNILRLLALERMICQAPWDDTYRFEDTP